MRRFRHLLPALGIALAISACAGNQKVAKVFPGEDPDYAESTLSSPSPKEEKGSDTKTPARRLSVPKGASEKNGLMMAVRIEGQEPKQDEYTVKAGNSFLVNAVVRNLTSNSVPVAYATDKRFDVEIFKDPDQREAVHLWSEHRLFVQAFQEVMLGGGTTVSRMLDIPTTKDASVSDMLEGDLGKPLTPGTYYLWATHEGRPFLAAGPLKIIVSE
jgi:hypothetical protein